MAEYSWLIRVNPAEQEHPSDAYYMGQLEQERRQRSRAPGELALV